jgi:hypothetical protein
MAIDLGLNKGKTKDDISRILKDAGASEVNVKTFE